METKRKFYLSDNKITILWCAATAFLLLLLCSRSSFLYPCNDWNDANSYFTMGKGMMNGQVIYRDLYDQKGPYLYLAYGIAYLLKHDSFAGVFLLEIIAISTFLFSCHKIITLYCRQEISRLLLPLLGAFILSSKSFYWGGAAEEFCLPLMGFSLYFSMKYFKEQTDSTPCFKMILLNGIFAGIVMQVKYTMLGFYFAWMAMMAFAFLAKKNWLGFLRGCLTFLGGMLLTAVPWLIYFGINGALDDWYQCYIYNNIFLYSNLQEEGNTVFNRIYELAKLLYWLILDNLSYFAFILLGFLSALLSRKVRWFEKVNILALIGFLFLGIYVGGSVLPYYSIPLTIFAVLGFVIIGQLSEKLSLQKVLTKYAPAFMIVSTIVGMLFSHVASMNTYFMKQEQDSYFLYQFRDIVLEEEQPTLLNIGCLDAGLYTVADIIPTCKFFQTNGIAFDTMFKEQERYVSEAQTMFIIARDEYPEVIWENYDLVSEAPYEWDGNTFTYYLFKKKS